MDDDAERPDVGRSRRPSTADEDGIDVLDRVDWSHPGHGKAWGEELGHPEIGELRPALVQLDVVRLDVAVGNTGFVKSMGSTRRVGHGAQDLGTLQGPRRRGQRTHREVLHGVEEAVPVLTRVEERDQVRRLDRGEDAQLAGGTPKAVVRRRPVQDLDDHQVHVERQPRRRLRQVVVAMVPLAQPTAELVVRDLVHVGLPVVTRHRSVGHLPRA